MERQVLRVLTYNIHHCRGVDGVLSPSRIASVIAATAPDVVALQEVDRNRARSGHVDQAEAIAREVNMRQVYFHPAMRVVDEEYGDAILTTVPSRLHKAGALPSPGRREPRGAQWVVLEVGGVEVQMINTHLGLLGPERRMQAEALLGPDWLGHPCCRDPVILLGDFNSLPIGRVYRSIASRLRDAHLDGALVVKATFPTRIPIFRLDHVFVSRSIETRTAERVRTPTARRASDHCPLLMELDWPKV